MVTLALLPMKVPAFVSEGKGSRIEIAKDACANGAQRAAGDGRASG